MKTNRREFLQKAGTLTLGMGLFPTIVKASALGLNGRTPPSDKITLIMIGCGAMGKASLRPFLQSEDVQVLAICDVDDGRLSDTKTIIDNHYGNADCRTYKDFREILEKENTDTAVLSLPDHWHAIISCATANKKIDIYGEKPLARTMKESRAIVDAVQRNGIVWQTGSQQRSETNFHRAAELVRNGRIGKIEYVEVGLMDGGHYTGNPPIQPVPQNLDWEMWLGPAPEVPYRGISHWNWRWIMDYSGGQLTDWAGHHVDIAHWGLGFDRTGPVSIEGTGRFNVDGIYNVPTDYDIHCKYANGLHMRVANAAKLEHGLGTLWKGTEGWIHVDRGSLKASNDNILKEKIGDDEIRLYKSTDHRRDFLNCVRSRKEPVAPAEIGHRSISVAFLGEIAILTGQKLSWNPETESFTDNNRNATRLLTRPYRQPWTFPV